MSILKNGTRVITTKDADHGGWRDPSRPKARWGVLGTIVDHSNSHGLCYLIEHDQLHEAWYDEEEIELVDKDTVPLRVIHIEGRVGIKHRDKIREKYLDKIITPEQLLKLAQTFDIMLISKDGEIKVRIDRKGYRFKQR